MAAAVNARPTPVLRKCWPNSSLSVAPTPRRSFWLVQISGSDAWRRTQNANSAGTSPTANTQRQPSVGSTSAATMAASA